ncbi:BRISC and BRCA1-A complex member 2-like [Xenia sp. Carnegie-2017]|uniref:BRISC and BRCA1-A complex member 2-like n=1 Tax=Xenia sp. Carnegie-2017 TaxID=2897299 RepID=UPI001F03C28A|nr:BRISC and BRCA1-A complex member 2-like [Xenia sp. Carnegie-2017]
MAASLANEIGKFAFNLVENGHVVTCTGGIRIEKIRSGSSVRKRGQCDRFTLRIPYGGTKLNWEVLFNGHEPHLPPDIIFDDADADFEPKLEEMLSLQCWNPEDHGSLMAVIKELLEQYKKHQLELLKESSPIIQHEFESVHELSTCTIIEVFVLRNSKGIVQQINFLMKLPIDLDRLPPYLINKNLGEDSISLFVVYQGCDGNNVSPQVYLSPRVEHAFSDVSLLNYPKWKDSGESLVSYIMAVHEFFNAKIDEITTSFERRRKYVAAFLSSFGTCVLEYDVERYSTLSFLVEFDYFYCIWTIEIGLEFPEEQPLFIMKSVYHCFDDKPYEAIDDNYPYSPRWGADEMARRARTYLATAIPRFKAASIKNKPYQPPGL